MSTLLNHLLIKLLEDAARDIPMSPLYVTQYLMESENPVWNVRYIDKIDHKPHIITKIIFDKTINKFIEERKVDILSNRKIRKCRYSLIDFFYKRAGYSLYGMSAFYSELPVEFKEKVYAILGEDPYE